MNSASAWRLSLRLAAAAAVAFGTCAAAHAQDASTGQPGIDAYAPREVGMLPRYCIHTQIFRQRVPGGADMAEIERWRAIMGPTFEAMHHYCWGLMKTNRALLMTQDRQRRLFYLSDAIGEYDFVLDKAPEDFILLPEILMRKGQNLVRLGKGPTGVFMFERAIELKPDYWPPYGELSDYYKEAGDARKAREALERGLAASPDASGLKRRLAELAGASGTTRRKAAPAEAHAADSEPRRR